MSSNIDTTNMPNKPCANPQLIDRKLADDYYYVKEIRPQSIPQINTSVLMEPTSSPYHSRDIFVKTGCSMSISTKSGKQLSVSSSTMVPTTETYQSSERSPNATLFKIEESCEINNANSDSVSHNRNDNADFGDTVMKDISQLDQSSESHED